MLAFLRRKGARLEMFRPVEDLAMLTEDRHPNSGISYGQQIPMAKELERFVIKVYIFPPKFSSDLSILRIDEF